VPFRSSTFMLITMGLLILAGNTWYSHSSESQTPSRSHTHEVFQLPDISTMDPVRDAPPPAQASLLSRVP
jgi:hypothetical protein